MAIRFNNSFVRCTSLGCLALVAFAGVPALAGEKVSTTPVIDLGHDEDQIRKLGLEISSLLRKGRVEEAIALEESLGRIRLQILFKKDPKRALNVLPEMLVQASATQLIDYVKVITQYGKESKSKELEAVVSLAIEQCRNAAKKCEDKQLKADLLKSVSKSQEFSVGLNPKPNAPASKPTVSISPASFSPQR